MAQKIRFAVIGAGRGKTFIRAAENPDLGIELVAVCDNNPEALQPWKDIPGLKLYTEYEQILDHPDVDAVCLATPVNLHGRQAIAALDAGKHVLSEVTATYNLEECRDLIAAVERTGLTYMMAENYWSSIIPLSAQSIAKGNAPVDVPDFCRTREADRKSRATNL